MLTFDELRRQNMAREQESFPEVWDNWTLSDFACGMGGECGEALNIVKKLRRRETYRPDHPAQSRRTTEELIRDLGDELADLIVYADLLAEHAGIDLGDAVARKFNEVSGRVNSTRTLPVKG